jgi:Homeodomain-like domain
MGVKQTVDTAKNTSPNSIFIGERRQRALELRKKKLSLDAIASELGCSRATAYRDVMEAKKGVISAELAKAALAEDMAVFGKLLATFLPLAEKGNEAAARIVLATTEQRAKQLGTVAQPGKLNPYIPAPPMGDGAEQLGIDVRFRFPDWVPPPADISPAKPAAEAQRPPSLPAPEYRFEPSPIPVQTQSANAPTGADPEPPPGTRAFKQGDTVYFVPDGRRH